MTSMFLLSISHDKTHKTPPVEKNLGYIDTFGSTKRLILKSQGNTIYRLIDEKTGQVIKNQILLVSGKKLQVSITNNSTIDRPSGVSSPNTKIVIDIDGAGSGTTTQTIWLDGVSVLINDPATLKTNGVLIA